MLVTVFEEDRYSEYPCADDAVSVEVFGRICTVLVRGNRISVRLPQALHSTDALSFENSGLIDIVSEDGMSAQIFAVSDMDGFQRYRRFYSEDQLIEPVCRQEGKITVDMENMRIRVDGRIHAACGGRRCEDTADIHYGQRICYGGMVLILQKDFFLINCLYPAESAYVPFHARCPIPVFASENSVPLHYVIDPVILPSEEIDLVPFHMPSQSRSVPYLISGGSMILMASASASAAILGAYRGYLSGKELIDILPQLILPAVMLVSALIIQPLSSFLHKRARRLEKEESEAEYIAYLQRTAQQAAERRGCLIGETQEILRTLRSSGNVRHGDRILLDAGAAYDLWPITLREKEDIRVSVRIAGEMENIRALLAAETQAPWRIDLNRYRNILIVQKTFDYAQKCAEALAGTYSPDELLLCFTAPEEWFRENIWPLQFDHSVLANGRRACVFNEESMRMFLLQLTAEQRTAVQFIIDADDAADVSDCLRIYCADSEDGRYHDLVLEPEKGIAYDYIARKVLRFTPCQESYVPCRRKGKTVQAAERGSGFMDLYGGEKPDIPQRWKEADPDETLSVPVGIAKDGSIISLDISDGGDGPHGLIAGTTGSGKSEWILSLMMSLCINYSPEQISFVLIDFKGGSLVHPLMYDGTILPHIAGVLSNLDESSLFRVKTSLARECTYRQRLFASAASHNEPVTDISSYRKFRKKHPELPVLADLVIIVDEFAQLKAGYPEFLDELISAARIGRSLGIHLILSTQKPGGIVTDQIWSNARFKVCLKVAEKQDSMEMIGVPDAAELSEAGEFILMKDRRMVRGRSGYLGAPAVRTKPDTILLDPSLKPVGSQSSRTETSDPQIRILLMKILAVSGCTARRLWQDELSEISVSDLSADMIGRIDDFYHNEQPQMPVPHGISAVLVSDLREKKAWLQTILFVLCRSRRKILLSDDTLLREEPWWKYVRDRVQTARGDFSRADEYDMVIIPDYAEVRKSMDLNARCEFLQNCQIKGVSLIVHISSGSDLSYRETAFFRQKYALSGMSLSDTSSFFESRQRLSLTKRNHGIIGLRQSLEFCFASVKTEDWERVYGTGPSVS